MSTAIIRLWRASVARDRLDDWVQVYCGRVLGKVRPADGFGAFRFLAEPGGEPCRAAALTQWTDLPAISRFFGGAPARAVIPDFAERFADCDHKAGFYDIVLSEVRA